MDEGSKGCPISRELRRFAEGIALRDISKAAFNAGILGALYIFPAGGAKVKQASCLSNETIASSMVFDTIDQGAMSRVKQRSTAVEDKNVKRIAERLKADIPNTPYEGEEGADDNAGEGNKDDDSDESEEEKEHFYRHEKRGPAMILKDAK